MRNDQFNGNTLPTSGGCVPDGMKKTLEKEFAWEPSMPVWLLRSMFAIQNGHNVTPLRFSRSAYHPVSSKSQQIITLLNDRRQGCGNQGR